MRLNYNINEKLFEDKSLDLNDISNDEVTIKYEENTLDINEIKNRIKELKSKYPEIEILNFEIKSKRSYIIDEKDVQLLVDINKYCKENNIQNKLFLHNDQTYFNDATISDFLIARDQIEKFVDKINNFHYVENGKKSKLSTFEKFLIAYKFVASREYLQCDLFCEMDMRTWMGLLTTKYAICSGFSSLLLCVCERIFDEKDVKTYRQALNVYDYENGFKEGGHSNNLVIIKDDKYDIHGLYYVDACWDCEKRSNNYNSTYKYSLLPISEILKDKKYKYDFEFTFLYDKINPFHFECNDIERHTLDEEVLFDNISHMRVSSSKLINDLAKKYGMDTIDDLNDEKLSKQVEVENFYKKINSQIQEIENVNKKLIDKEIDKFLKENFNDSILKFEIPFNLYSNKFKEKPELVQIMKYLEKINLLDLDKEETVNKINEYINFFKNNDTFYKECLKEANNPCNTIPKGAHIDNLLKYNMKKLYNDPNAKSFLDLELADVTKSFEGTKQKFRKLRDTIYADEEHMIYAPKIPLSKFEKAFSVIGKFFGFKDKDLKTFIDKEMNAKRQFEQELNK